MSREIELSCRCGSVRGRVSAAPADVINRAVCYCEDCQAFAHWLQRRDLLNAHGGSDIAQVAPAAVRFENGQDRIRCVRLTEKGLFRWYASCCNTPVGNTLKPAIPFVGILVHTFAGGPAAADTTLGPSRGTFRGERATGELPKQELGFPVGVILRALARVLMVRLRGRGWPNPFFGREGQPLYAVQILTAAERDALRPLCGPAAAAS